MVYSNGLLFDGVLGNALIEQLHRVEGNKASCIIIDGSLGSGKTTLAVECGDFLSRKPIVMKEQIGMGGVDFQETIEIAITKGYVVVIYDEAGDFNRRGAITKFNQMLNRVFDTYRTFKILVILVVPNFFVLDSNLFLNQIPRMLIHCDREVGYNYSNYSVYSLYSMFYLRDTMKKLIVPQQAYGMTIPNFRGHFKDLPTERADALRELSTSAKRQIISKNLIQAKGLISAAQIAYEVKKSKAWVNMKINALHIKPKQLYKNKRYYEKQEIIARLGIT